MPTYLRSSTINGYYAGVQSSRDYRSGWVHVDVIPLPSSTYTRRFDTSLPVSTSAPHRKVTSTYCYATLSDSDFTTLEQRAQQAAFARFRGKVFEGAEMGLALAERREAAELIASRVLQLTKAFGALRKGRFKAFVRALGIRPKPKHSKTRWTRPKDAASLWLEYWLGWAPMIGDVYAAIDVMQSPYPSLRVRASASRRGTFTMKTLGSYAVTCDLKRVARVGYLADVTVDNPLLFRANQLGLINPVAVAWAVVPFSFIVDWFIPVGAFLSYPTAFTGLTVTDKQMTVKRLQEGMELRWNSTTGAVESNSNCLGVSFNRTLGFTTPKLVLKGGNQMNLTRAATAVSLLVSLFTKG